MIKSRQSCPFDGELKPAVPTLTMPIDEVQAIIGRAHGVAADLSRASMLTRAPLSSSLKRIATKIEGSLRNEGL